MNTSGYHLVCDQTRASGGGRRKLMVPCSQNEAGRGMFSGETRRPEHDVLWWRADGGEVDWKAGRRRKLCLHGT